jgi:short-subunit dehydrogenase
VLCLSTGVGLGGPFVETDLKRELKMIDLNCRGVVQLTKLVVQDMVALGRHIRCRLSRR